MDDFLYTVEELSDILNISEATIMELAKTKQLPCIYICRKPRFHMETLLEYFKTLEGGAL